MVVFDRWMGNQHTEGGWGKQPRHLTINQGRQLWVLRETDCPKMDEAREKKKRGVRRGKGGVGGKGWVGGDGRRATLQTCRGGSEKMIYRLKIVSLPSFTC